jgi:hypothetical protein
MSFHFGNTCSKAHAAANELEMLRKDKADHLRNWITYAHHSPVYAVDTFSAIATWIAVALVDVDLTVGSCGARLAAALVAINEVLTMATKLAGVALTLVDLCLAEVASKTRVTVASE